MFYSTRNNSEKVSASKAIINGLAPDKGLYLPEDIKPLKIDEKLLKSSYQDLAYQVLRLYLDDFTDDEIKSAIDKAYNSLNFKEKIIGVKPFNNYAFLELFYGPTITFKDMALTLLPHLMDIAIKKQNIDKKVMILTATSGDTGSAVLSGFSKAQNIEISVLYPEGGISPIQEKQMLYFTSPTSRAYSVRHANFDDCQNTVKAMLNEGSNEYILTSANSINVGRLLPQIIYYYASYIELVNTKQIKLGDQIDVVVPTGNFGNILACYLAKTMGLPVHKLVCASNANRVLTDFFETGTYSLKRDFIKTNSPSMDILISSNFERLISLCSANKDEVSKYMDDLKSQKEFTVSSEIIHKLQNEFEAYSINEEETLKLINQCFSDNNYLIDPHTAVSYGAYLKHKQKSGYYTLVVSTASPYKFKETIMEAFNQPNVNNQNEVFDFMKTKLNSPMPIQLEQVINHKIQPKVMTTDSCRKVIFNKKPFKVITPASSANLGPGFDACGLALDLFNEFRFTRNNKDKLVGFPDDLNNSDNMVLTAYQFFFKKTGIRYQPAQIEQVRNDIPVSRGLGSSSSCIVAGLLAANHMATDPYQKAEILEMASELEGHPDNVAPCLFGGFVNVVSDNGQIKLFNFNKVDENLKFILCIPNQKMATKEARQVLPTSLNYKDIVYNLSRAMNLPQALARGDLYEIKESMKDSVHTPYRLPLIHGADIVKEFADKNELPFTISGSGSTLLIISEFDDTIEELKKLKLPVQYEFKNLKVNTTGSQIKED